MFVNAVLGLESPSYEGGTGQARHTAWMPPVQFRPFAIPLAASREISRLQSTRRVMAFMQSNNGPARTVVRPQTRELPSTSPRTPTPKTLKTGH